MRRECLEKTELERSKFEIRNSEVGMEPTPSSGRPEQTKRKTHPFKGQNRKGRAPRQEKTNSKSFRQVQSVSPAGVRHRGRRRKSPALPNRGRGTRPPAQIQSRMSK